MNIQQVSTMLVDQRTILLQQMGSLGSWIQQEIDKGKGKKLTIICSSSATLLFFIIRQARKRYKLSKYRYQPDKPPVVTYSFFSGYLFGWMKAGMTMGYAAELFKKYGDTLECQTNPFRPFSKIITKDPTVMRFVLQSNVDYFLKGFLEKDMFAEMIQGGFIAQDHGKFAKDGGKEWKIGRNVGTSSMSMSKFQDILDDTLKTKGRVWDKLLFEAHEKNESFNMTNFARRYAIDVFCSFAYGIDLKCLDDPEKKHPFVSSSTDLGKYMVLRFLNPIWKICRFFRCVPYEWFIIYHLGKLNTVTRDLVKQAKEASEKPGGRRTLITEALEKSKVLFQNEASSTFSEPLEFVRVFTMNLMQAALDTTSTATMWTLFELMKHPNVYKRLQKELDDGGGDISYTDLMRSDKYPILHGVTWEGLRINPPVPMVIRECVADVTLPSGHRMEEGDSVQVDIRACGRDPDLWENPTEMRPERWIVPDGPRSPKNHIGSLGPQFKKNTAVASFLDPDMGHLPIFIFGARECIGKSLALYEVKHVLAHLLYNFDLEIDEESKKLTFDDLVFKPDTPMHFRAKPRKERRKSQY